jgi:hypothetical protein
MALEIVQREAQLAIGHDVDQLHLVRHEAAVDERTAALETDEGELSRRVGERQVDAPAAERDARGDDGRRFFIEAVARPCRRVVRPGAGQRVVAPRVAQHDGHEAADVDTAVRPVFAAALERIEEFPPGRLRAFDHPRARQVEREPVTVPIDHALPARQVRAGQ